MEFYSSNLLTALSIAMKKAREEEAKNGYTRDSGFVSGLQELYDAIESGDDIIMLKG